MKVSHPAERLDDASPYPQRLGYTKKQIHEATGRSVPSINRDAATPGCPLVFMAYPGQHAVVAEPESYEAYLRWLSAKAKPAKQRQAERRQAREAKKRGA